MPFGEEGGVWEAIGDKSVVRKYTVHWKRPTLFWSWSFFAPSPLLPKQAVHDMEEKKD
jgi:hypothetical protein